MAVTKGSFGIGTSSSNITEFKGITKSIKQTNESLASEDSGRTMDGVMHVKWLKNKLRKWEIELVPCDATTVYNVLSRVQGRVYYIRIFDISTNAIQTVHVYTSNTEADCYSGILHNGLYQGVSFSAIEIGD